MGSGRWDASVYASTTSSKLRSHGTAFAYDDDVKSGRTARVVHATLDPKWKAGAGSPFEGLSVRESRDTDEHPESRAIAVLFDVTGSMGGIPYTLQTKLPKLHALVLQKGYIEHPQILFGAIGDAWVDSFPLQLGQFESDNRMDENLENFILEGGGGGQVHESYELGMYFLARHTALDCLEKRGQKGYCFIIGDEKSYNKVHKDQVNSLIDPGSKLETDIPVESIVDELKKKYDVYFLYAAEGSYSKDEILGDGISGGMHGPGWRKLLGQNAMVLERSDAVCETIAAQIGIGEGYGVDEVIEHLKELGTESEVIEATSHALVAAGATAGPVSTASGSIPDDGEDGTERL